MTFSPKAVFSNFARQIARMAGHPLVFFVCVALVLLWVLSGPYFDYSDTWQLIINTATTIVTFLMVFLIQNTQNRDTDAIQIKLNEIIRALQGAHNAVVSLEDLDEDQLAQLRTKYAGLAEQARRRLERGGVDTDAPDLSVDACKSVASGVQGVQRDAT